MKAFYEPWHKITILRDDMRRENYSLSDFAADLYDVVLQKGQQEIYKDPAKFFELTYPTKDLRKLVKAVALRLNGQSDEAYRKLSITYGGGKTHTLITLRHLAYNPDALPDLPAVRAFETEIGFKMPKARVAALCFDKIDQEKGVLTLGPDGTERQLKYPWNILAFQLAGAEGLRLIHADGKDEERDSPPTDPLLKELLSLPQKEGLATLVLLDETLMYIRNQVERDPNWRGRIKSFFQYLTQAVVKTERCAMVVSLLASDPKKYDDLGKELSDDLSSIFVRQEEVDSNPVGKADVVEILRRRFFTPESIGNQAAFQPQVIAVVKGIAALDGETRKEKQKKEEEYLKSYPFHPMLIDLFYSRWNQLDKFQRTRGILRTFATALRDAEKWDKGPLIGANVFLAEPGNADLAQATMQLNTYANTSKDSGNEQQWQPILESELEKARQVQVEMATFSHREIEKAVMAVFLSSQPIGQKASTQELLVLLGATDPDKIELEKALLRWTEVSWFLDETEVATGIFPDKARQLPKAWRLGDRPNLRQMHNYACTHRVSSSQVKSKLIESIPKLRTLIDGASVTGAKVHKLPERPSDIPDDGQFHYAVLSPEAVSESGKPSPEAKRFIDDTTSTDRPRIRRNLIVLAVPSKEGLNGARTRVREYLGWEEVREQLKGQSSELSRKTMPSRKTMIEQERKQANERMLEAIKQAYSIVVTVGEDNNIHAFKIAVRDESLFSLIKNDKRSRIQEIAIRPDALLTGAPYNLWKEGEQSRRVKHLVDAFAQNTKLPKMLRPKEILNDVVLKGVEKGIWVARVERPDGTANTFWRTLISEAALKDPELELLLPQAATLNELSADLLAYQNLPDLWPTEEISVQDVYDYFAGGRTVSQPSGDGYEEEQVIPKCEPAIVEAAIEKAVEQGLVWLTNEPASILGEPVPQGILNASASLRKPPEDIPVDELMPSSIPSAWEEEKTSAFAIVAALSSKRGITLPWPTVKIAIMAGIQIRWLELSDGNIPWPCDLAGAQKVMLQKPSGVKEDKGEKTTRPLTAETFLEIGNIQDLADQIPDITKKAAGNNIKFKIYIELGDGKTPPDNKTVEELNQLLSKVSDKLRLR